MKEIIEENSSQISKDDNSNPKTYYSIYCIDNEAFLKDKKVLEFMENTFEDEKVRIYEKVKKYLSYIIKKDNRNSCIFEKEKNDNIVFYTFKTKTKLAWSESISNQMDDALHIKSYENTTCSYIIMFEDNSKILICTGGNSQNYLINFIEPKFGLSIIQKIFNENDGCIKRISTNSIDGVRLGSDLSNRSVTNFAFEKNLSKISKSCLTEIDIEKLKELGINASGNSNRKFSIDFSNSFRLLKAITYNELHNLIINLFQISKKDNKFALNYLLPIKDLKDIKTKEMEQKLTKEFDDPKKVRCGFYYSELSNIMDSAEFIISSSCNNEFKLNFDTIPDYQEIETELKNKYKGKYNFSYLYNNGRFSIKNNENRIILDTVPLKKYIQINYIYEDNSVKHHFYRIDNTWYFLGENVKALLKKQFDEYLNKNENSMNSIKLKLSNHAEYKDENTFNLSFKSSATVICCHTKQINRVELCDLMYEDNNSIYLIANKNKFNGSSTRDCINQIRTASKLLLSIRSILDANIINAYQNKLKKQNPNQSEFIEKIIHNLFYSNAHNIIFVAGYLSNTGLTCDSYYAKYLTLAANNELNSFGFNLVTIDI